MFVAQTVASIAATGFDSSSVAVLSGDDVVIGTFSGLFEVSRDPVSGGWTNSQISYDTDSDDVTPSPDGSAFLAGSIHLRLFTRSAAGWNATDIAAIGNRTSHSGRGLML